jgi:hypothetical protein
MTASWIGTRHPTDIVNGVSNLVATSPNLQAIPIDGAAHGYLELFAQQPSRPQAAQTPARSYFGHR